MNAVVLSDRRRGVACLCFAIVASSTAAAKAAIPVALQVRPEFAPISHDNVTRKLQSSWQGDNVCKSAESKAGAITQHLPAPSNLSVGQKYYLAYVDQVAQTEHLRGFRRTFRGIGGLTDVAPSSTTQDPERDVRRSKLEKVTAGYVQRDPALKYEFIGLDRKSADELPKDDLHLTDPLKVDPLITDLVYLLPPPKSAIGAHWNIPIESVTTLLAPGGNLLPQRDPRTEGPTGDGMWFHALSAFIELSPDWMLVGASGTATATLESISKSADEPIALIRLKVHLKNTRDAAYDLGVEAKGAVPEGTRYEYKHAVELELQGEGELQWRVRDGYVQQYTLKADAEVKERAEAAVHIPAGSKVPEQSGSFVFLWKGKVEATGLAEVRK